MRTSHNTSSYVWDVNRGLPEILQETIGSNTTSYVYGLGRISSTDGAGNQTYFTSDGLGSTTDLTNSASPPQQTDGYTYDAFGAATHSPGTSTQPFQFTGQQTDADSALQYLRARYYDQASGRFLGRDPVAGSLGIPATQNAYAYGLNNPTTWTDPSGLCVLSCEGGSWNRTAADGDSADDFFSALREYLACVDFGVGLAILVLQLTPVGAQATIAGGILSAVVAGVAYSDSPEQIPGQEVKNGVITLAPDATKNYAKRTLQTYKLYGTESGPRYGAKFAASVAGLTVAAALTAYTGDQCAQRVGLYKFLGINR